MTIPDAHSDLELALRLADAADAVSLPRFRASDLHVETKPDMTPVTDADRSVERALREILAAERPEDSIVGEEYGLSGDSPRRWFLDPIDGTKNFVRGIPVYATLIALVVDGEPVVGAVSAPALSRRWTATRGGGAHLNGTAIRVSGVSRPADAQLSYNDQRTFARHGYGAGAELLTRAVWRVRGFGDFWSHMLVAEGAVDIAVEPTVNPWDLAPLQVIVEEAGGRFSDLAGRRGFEGGSALATNGLLHDEVLAMFGGGVSGTAAEPEKSR